MRNNLLDLLKSIAVASMIFIHTVMWLHDQIYFPIFTELPYLIGRVSMPLFFFCSGATIAFTHNSTKQMIIECVILFLLGMVWNLTIGYLLFGITNLWIGALQLIAVNKLIIYFCRNLNIKGLIITVDIYLLFVIAPMQFDLNFFVNLGLVLFPLGYIFAKYWNYNIKKEFYLGRISLTVFLSHQFIILYPYLFFGLYFSINIFITYLIVILYILLYYFLSKLALKSKKLLFIEYLFTMVIHKFK